MSAALTGDCSDQLVLRRTRNFSLIFLDLLSPCYDFISSYPSLNCGNTFEISTTEVVCSKFHKNIIDTGSHTKIAEISLKLYENFILKVVFKRVPNFLYSRTLFIVTVNAIKLSSQLYFKQACQHQNK
jgi:hypothetical protein